MQFPAIRAKDKSHKLPPGWPEISNVKIHRFGARSKAEHKVKFFFLRPSLDNLTTLATLAHNDESADLNDWFVVFVPYKPSMLDTFLDRECLCFPNVIEWDNHWIVWDRDVISLEMPGTYRSVVQGLEDSVYATARGLISLEKSFGVVPVIRAKGPCAMKVAELIQSQRKENATELDATDISPYSEVIILDRQLDLPAVMMTQVTHEGMMYEMNIGQMKHTRCKVARAGAIPQADEKAKPPTDTKYLNNTDQIYRMIQDEHVSHSWEPLTQAGHAVADWFAESEKKKESLLDFRGGGFQETTKEIVEKTARKESIEMHMRLLKEINDSMDRRFYELLEFERNLVQGTAPMKGKMSPYEYVSDAIAAGSDITYPMRLMCLYSLTCNGVPAKNYNRLCVEFCQQYGFAHLVTLQSLEEAGLFVVNSHPAAKAGKWRDKAKKAMSQINPEVDINDPDDEAYVYQCYAPLLCRIVSYFVSAPATSGIRSLFRSYPDEVIPFPGLNVDKKAVKQAVDSLDERDADSTVLVVVIGGVTSAE
ncbi:vacuolar protein sorting-associated protein 33, partial [Kipferlia bialata]|eukprot:g5980.t1